MIALPFPSLVKNIGARAIQGGLAFAPPIYPPSLRSLLEADTDFNALAGKKILSMHGAVDPLVPYADGQKDIEDVKRVMQNGDVEVWVEEGQGHVLTPVMVKKTAEWIWRWGLSDKTRE